MGARAELDDSAAAHASEAGGRSRERSREGAESDAAVAPCCPLYHEAVELVGRRWTGAILRVLMDGSGAKIVQPEHNVEGLGRVAVIEDPWGTKIELVQDPQLLGFHHARVRAVDPAAMRAWFIEKAGAQPRKMAGADALSLGGIWLLIDKADAH